MKDSKEFEKFDSAMRKVMRVSREELARREKEWHKEHPRTGKKRGRKPKTSALGRASSDKGS